MRSWALPASAVLLLALGGCGSMHGTYREPQAAAPASPGGGYTPPSIVQKRGGAYYQDDGPGENPPANLEQTPDAVPRDEPPVKSAANRPYVVFGKTYVPTAADAEFQAARRCLLVWPQVPRPENLVGRGLRHVRHVGGAPDPADSELRAGHQPRQWPQRGGAGE